MKLDFKNRLYVVRHGQTVWNREHRYQGREDSPLTEQGVFQAHKAADNLKNKNIEQIIASPLGRAMMTAQIIAQSLEVNNIYTEPFFKERDYGCYEGLTKNEIEDLYPELNLKDATHQWDFAPYEAETLHEFEQRVIQGLKKIYRDFENKTILLVVHSGVMRMLNKYFRDIPETDKFFEYYPDNGEVENY